MKIKLFFIILISILFLNSCNNLGIIKEKTEYEKFTEMYDKAVKNFNKSGSYRLQEEFYFNFKINSQQVNTSLESTSDMIKKPFYLKSIVSMNISTIGTIEHKALYIEQDGVYKQYFKSFAGHTEKTLTKDELDEECKNDELDITVKHVPKSTEIKEEKLVNNEKIITYETTFTINDLQNEDKMLFDEVLETFIGVGVKSSSYLDIQIIKRIVINTTTKQLVEILYDMTNFMTKAYDDFNTKNQLGLDITDTKSEYKFIFSNFNKVTKDNSFIEEMKP